MSATIRDLAECESSIMALQSEVTRTLGTLQSRLQYLGEGYYGTSPALSWRDYALVAEQEVVSALMHLRD